MWPTMNRLHPTDDSPESVEGTAAHWVVSEMLADRTHPEGSLAPNGVMVSGEMLDGAELFCDAASARIGPQHAPKLHIEETIAAPQIHADCFGTPDLWWRTGHSRHIEIFDYKFGHGFVDEYFNLQGLTYLAGILHLEWPAEFPADITVSFTIVQPRCFQRGEPVRTHSFSVKDIPPYMRLLRAAALAATQPNPAATTNDECKYCPGRHACSALQQAAYSDAEFSNNRQPHNLTPQSAALELRMLERAYSRLEARVEGLRELTLANIKAGANIPYYRAEPGRGRTQWNSSPEQIITIGQMLGKDLSKPGVVTPAQAKKIGVDDSVITAYSVNTSGSIKLIAVNNDDAARVFARSGE